MTCTRSSYGLSVPSRASTLMAAAMSATLTSRAISSTAQREQHLHGLGPVDQGQALLRREDQRLDPGLGKQLGGRPAAQVGVTAAAQPALADQRLGQVRELREVARRRPPSPCRGSPAAGRARAARAAWRAARPGRPSSRRSGSGPAAAAGRAPRRRAVARPLPRCGDRISASCIRSRSPRPTCVSARAPKPVVMPYMTVSRSTASATTARLGAIRAATPSPRTAPA